MILATIEDDIKQIQQLISYHKGIIANAKLYARPTEEALEELTSKYLQELGDIRKLNRSS